MLRRSASSSSNVREHVAARRRCGASQPSWLAHTIAIRWSGSTEPEFGHRRGLHRLQRRSGIDRDDPGRRPRRSIDPSGASATAAPWNSDSSKPLRVATASGPNASSNRVITLRSCHVRAVSPETVGPSPDAGARGSRRGGGIVGEMAVDDLVPLAPLARRAPASSPPPAAPAPPRRHRATKPRRARRRTATAGCSSIVRAVMRGAKT